jgi:hypothetical protein
MRNIFLYTQVVFCLIVISEKSSFAQQCSGYFVGGPSIVCKGDKPSYYVGGGNTSNCSIVYVSGSGNSFSGSVVTWGGAPGTYEINFSCPTCSGTPYKTVTVESATIAGGSISNSSQTICSGTTPTPLTATGYTGYVTGWEKKRPAEVSWTSIGSATNPLSSNYINNTETFQYRMKVQNNCGGAANTAIATVNVNTVTKPPIPTIITSTSCGPQTLRMLGSPPPGITWYWQGQTANGSIINNASADFTATVSGIYIVGAKLGSCWEYMSVYVTVTNLPLGPSPSLSLNVSSNACGPNTITRVSGTPTNANEEWFWQKDQLGQERGSNAWLNPSGYTVSTLGTKIYYLRTYNSQTTCWSNPGESYTAQVTVNQSPDTPPQPTVFSSNDCGDKILTVAGSPSDGSTWYWQGITPNGNVTNSASAPYSANISGTNPYYVGAKIGLCWSYNKTVPDVTIKPIPPAPSFGAIAQFCGFAKVSKSINDPSWFWLPDASTLVETNNSLELVVTSDKTIYLGSKGANGCWNVKSLFVDVSNELPVFDVTPSAYVCSRGKTMLTATGTGIIAYLWYDNDTGNYLGKGSSYETPELTNTTFIKVVGYSDIGCSSERLVFVQIYATPTEKPLSPVPSRVGNSYFLDINNSNTAQSSFFWVSSPDGTETASYPNPRLVQAGFYYVRVRNPQGCWGPSTIIEAPDFSPTDYDQPVDVNDVNFVRSYTMQGKNIAGVLDNLGPDQVAQKTKYIDGLGRPFQEVSKQNSPLKKDLVQINNYDRFGREATQLLSYASSSINGTVQVQPYTDQRLFYQSADKIATSNDPISIKQFDLSPMNRVVKQGAPGTDWQPISGIYSLSDNSVKKRYEVNLTNEVLLFIYNPVTGMAALNPDPALQYYLQGQLYANRTYDEHNNEVIEYVDKEGRTVCKKVYLKTEVGIKQYASTYYIYDDLGNLVLVLPPEGVKAITNR